MLYALAEELLVSCSHAALPAIPVLSSVVPFVAAVACAVVGGSYLRLAFAAVLSGEAQVMIAKAALPAPALTVKGVASSKASKEGGNVWIDSGAGYRRLSSIDLQLPPALRDLLVAVNDGARGLAKHLGSPRALSSPAQADGTAAANNVLAIEYPSSKQQQVEAHPLDFDQGDETCSLIWETDSSINGGSSSDSLCVQSSPLALLGAVPLTGDASALDSVGRDEGCPESVRAVLPDDLLLQFGAMIGEQACTEELRRQGKAWAWGTASSLLGVPDAHAGGAAAPWEPIVRESSPTASYWAWRRPLRKGFYVYKARTLVRGVSAADLTSFNLSVRTRFLWDDTALLVHDLGLPPSDATTTPTGGSTRPKGSGSSSKSKFQQYKCRYPAPFANREYVYARRVWDRADGGAYVVSRACDEPEGAQMQDVGKRAYRVRDYVSCMVIRDVDGGEDGNGEPCAEVVTVYFEDPGMQAGCCSVVIRKGLWQFVQKHEAALRQYTAARHAARQQTSAEAGGGAGAVLTVVDAMGGDDDEAEAERLMQSGLLAARDAARRSGGGRRLVRCGSAALARPLRALASLPSHGPLRHRLVAALAFKLMQGVVAASEK